MHLSSYSVELGEDGPAIVDKAVTPTGCHNTGCTHSSFEKQLNMLGVLQSSSLMSHSVRNQSTFPHRNHGIMFPADVQKPI